MRQTSSQALLFFLLSRSSISHYVRPKRVSYPNTHSVPFLTSFSGQTNIFCFRLNIKIFLSNIPLCSRKWCSCSPHIEKETSLFGKHWVLCESQSLLLIYRFLSENKEKKRELSSKWLWNGTTGSTKVKVVFDWQLFESIENAIFEIYFGRTWQLHRLIYLTFMFVSDEPFFRSSSEYKLRHEFGPNAFKYRRKTELMQNQLLFIFSSPSKRFMQILNPMLLTNCHRWIDWYERFQFISFRNN